MAPEDLNFNNVRPLIVDGDGFAINILQQILRGFGAAEQISAGNGAEAKAVLERQRIDLLICEARLTDMRGAELIRWLRRLEDNEMRAMPIIVLTGYTERSSVAELRDAGANLVVRKPASPQALLARISWAAASPRPFVVAEGYAGPDRRFKFEGVPDGVGRRSSDLRGDIGLAVEPNMSQDEIDSVFKPMRVA